MTPPRGSVSANFRPSDSGGSRADVEGREGPGSEGPAAVGALADTSCSTSPPPGREPGETVKSTTPPVVDVSPQPPVVTMIFFPEGPEVPLSVRGFFGTSGAASLMQSLFGAGGIAGAPSSAPLGTFLDVL